jgi:hypothetical protein
MLGTNCEERQKGVSSPVAELWKKQQPGITLVGAGRGNLKKGLRIIIELF